MTDNAASDHPPGEQALHLRGLAQPGSQQAGDGGTLRDDGH